VVVLLTNKERNMSKETIDDGGQAFPRTKSAHGTVAGMTLRDYFAAAALQGMLASPKVTFSNRGFAINSYLIADAMLAERSKRNGGAS
jgi:hypothetical protein